MRRRGCDSTPRWRGPPSSPPHLARHAFARGSISRTPIRWPSTHSASATRRRRTHFCHVPGFNHQFARHLRGVENLGGALDVGAPGDVAGAPDSDGRRGSRDDAGASREGRGRRRHFRRRASGRRQVGDADAEPRLSRLGEWHRLVRAAVSHPAADADQLPRRVRRARSLADGRRRRHRRRAPRAAHPVLPDRPSRSGRIANQPRADAGAVGQQAGGPAALPRSDVGRRPAMKRLDALRAVYERLEDRIVVTIMGAVAAELQSLGHRPNFFYLQHAMGLASSMGLGIALSKPDRQVIVFDGDGSILMNLGGLTTLARYRPRNLVHVVFHNESLLSVGGFPTATATGSDLAGIAAAAGIPRTETVTTLADFTRAFADALAAGDLTAIVAKVEAIGPAAYVTDLSLLENRFQFARYLRS